MLRVNILCLSRKIGRSGKFCIFTQVFMDHADRVGILSSLWIQLKFIDCLAWASISELSRV